MDWYNDCTVAAAGSRLPQEEFLLARFHVKPLDETTWPDFARLVEKHNGVWVVAGAYLSSRAGLR